MKKIIKILSGAGALVSIGVGAQISMASCNDPSKGVAVKLVGISQDGKANNKTTTFLTLTLDKELDVFPFDISVAAANSSVTNDGMPIRLFSGGGKQWRLNLKNVDKNTKITLTFTDSPGYTINVKTKNVDIFYMEHVTVISCTPINENLTTTSIVIQFASDYVNIPSGAMKQIRLTSDADQYSYIENNVVDDPANCRWIVLLADVDRTRSDVTVHIQQVFALEIDGNDKTVTISYAKRLQFQNVTPVNESTDGTTTGIMIGLNAEYDEFPGVSVDVKDDEFDFDPQTPVRNESNHSEWFVALNNVTQSAAAANVHINPAPGYTIDYNDKSVAINYTQHVDFQTATPVDNDSGTTTSINICFGAVYDVFPGDSVMVYDYNNDIDFDPQTPVRNEDNPVEWSVALNNVTQSATGVSVYIYPPTGYWIDNNNKTVTISYT